jgi:Zn ribbon nucleic-acid-binding protein
MPEQDFIIKDMTYNGEKWKIQDSHQLARFNKSCSHFADVNPRIPKCIFDLLRPATKCCKQLCPIRLCPNCGKKLLIKLEKDLSLFCVDCGFKESYAPKTVSAKKEKQQGSQFCFNCGKPLRNKNAAVTIEDTAHNRIGFDCYCATCGWSGDVFPDSLSKDALEKDVKKESGSI